MSLLDEFKNKKIIHISHNDLDGVGSIIIGKYYIEPVAKKYTVVSCDYNDNILIDASQYLNYDIVIFTDITPSLILYDTLKDCKNVLIFDHHQSARTNLMNNVLPQNYYYDIDKCGTKIFFDEIIKNTRASKCVWQFVELVNTYDLWNDKSALWNDSKSLHNILWGSLAWGSTNYVDKYKKFIDNQLEKFKKGKNFYLTQYEERLSKNALEKEKENLIFAKKNLQFRKDGEGNSYAYFECPSKISIIANHLLKEYNHLQYICGHSTYNDKNGVYDPSLSLRSLGGTDVSIIASLWESGGHKQAAGINFKDYNSFLKFRKGDIHLI